MFDNRRKDTEKRRIPPPHYSPGQTGTKPAWRLMVWQQSKGDGDPILATDRYFFDLSPMWAWLALDFGYIEDPLTHDDLERDGVACWADSELNGDVRDYWAWLQPGKMIAGQWKKSHETE